MGDNITASAAVSEASVSEIKDSEGIIAELEALKAENEALKKALEGAKTTDGGNETAVKVNKKSLFFDHEVLSDSGIVSGKYVPKTEPEYNRLAPFAVEEK